MLETNVRLRSAHVLRCMEHPSANPVYYSFEDDAFMLSERSQFKEAYLRDEHRKFTQLSAEAMFLVILAWFWTSACLHYDNVAHRVLRAADLAVDAHVSRPSQGWTVPSLRCSQVFLLGRVSLPTLPARLDKPRFVARWAQLRRNLVLHRVAQAAYLTLVFIVVVFAAAGGGSRLAHGG
ncbi:hypothetical protein CYMTET_4374 [Cymbomonas tetramitiformis]|uniref:Uncharacterized protein n=1 Tax=Cymbomonas tetramitiformis TaxID=36881 RepID=A0AAE0LKG1_9CHLO|nr:hypothetical protein CYMTET_4374 [Cymbomonas tetramitiformis]